MQGFFTDDILPVGTVAPDFTLLDQDGKSVSLSSFHGNNNVVLVFYPADATPG
jgi:peroxiredoxin Q/BCP